jgi:hypothetical protein
LVLTLGTFKVYFPDESTLMYGFSAMRGVLSTVVMGFV